MPMTPRRLYHAKTSLWKRIYRNDITPGAAPSLFTIRQTKPTSANVGAGIIRALPTVVATTADGTWSNGILTISTDLKDRIVNGTVKIATGVGGLTIENCIIKGDPAYPPTGSRYVIDTGGGSDYAPALIRYNTISPVVSSPHFNGVGPRNFIAEYNDISHTTDGFVSSQKNAVADVNMIIRGNYVHHFQFYAPDNTHSATPTTTAGGTTITGPWAGLGWNHCDAIQVEQDGTTGITLYGNNFVGGWANDSVSTLPLPNAVKEISCMMLNAGVNLVVEDNWFDGGEYCINNGTSAATGSFKRNRFGRGMDKTGTADNQYFALMLSSPGILTYDGTADQNVWEDTGQLVPRRGS